MLHLRAFLTTFLLGLNISFWIVPVLTLGLFKLFLPKGDLRNRTILTLAWLGERWVSGNDRIFDLMLPTEWDVRGVERLDPGGRYLIISNHQTWADIMILQRIFLGHAPFLRFFMKQGLIWVPLVGQGCWALEFPFLKRYSAEYLARHPEKRGEDIITARRACRRYLRIPVSILIFLEGSRYTEEKHADQDSPHRHLLRPRVGAISTAMAVMGDQINEFLDVTIVYRPERPTMWEFLGGGVNRVSVRVRSIAVPPEFRDEGISEPGAARDQFRKWVEDLWAEKDRAIDGIVREHL
jgi:1-acyl-sn-glycerol-3-phosphate acyltransferase